MTEIAQISADEKYQEILKKAEIAARTDATILIRGENGSGKEVLANFIHGNSSRAHKKMVVVNCAAIPEQLIESELFGYEEGSFTGAKKGGKTGKFELADGGTLFLDEIGDMPYSMQAKLLRVLQEGEIEKIGRQKSIPVDVRVIAATNQPLEQLIEEKRFRMDLFYRLNVISFQIPSLCERKKDVTALSSRFLQMFNERYGKKLTLGREAEQALLQYRWPGNVRELRNCMESTVIVCRKEEIGISDLPEYLVQKIQKEKKEMSVQDSEEIRNTECVMVPEQTVLSETAPVPGMYKVCESEMSRITDLQEEIRKYEKHLIDRMISYCNGDKNLAAKRLNISRRSLYRKLTETEHPAPAAALA